jgi:tetratricopeptide (TPR) repeat protein
MRKYIYIALLASALASCGKINTAKFAEHMSLGNAHFDTLNYTAALTHFLEANNYIDSNYTSYFNAGNAFLKLQQPDSALRYFEQSANFTKDSITKSNIWHNHGNSWLMSYKISQQQLAKNLQIADSLGQSMDEDIQSKIRSTIAKDSVLKENDTLIKSRKTILNSALVSYKQSLNYYYKNDSSQYNYIYALNLLFEEEKNEQNKKDDKKKEPTEFALKTKEKALELIKENQFKAAYKLLEVAQKKDETVSNFNELIGKLKDITEIIEKHGN